MQFLWNVIACFFLWRWSCFSNFWWCMKRLITHAWNCFRKRYRGPSLLLCGSLAGRKLLHSCRLFQLFQGSGILYFGALNSTLRHRPVSQLCHCQRTKSNKSNIYNVYIRIEDIWRCFEYLGTLNTKKRDMHKTGLFF